jgi:hypothetical protein
MSPFGYISLPRQYNQRLNNLGTSSMLADLLYHRGWNKLIQKIVQSFVIQILGFPSYNDKCPAQI